MSGLRSEHAHKSQKGYGVGVFSVVLSEMQKGAKDYLGGWEDMLYMLIQQLNTKKMTIQLVHKISLQFLHG